jgi:hypothetical protein
MQSEPDEPREAPGDAAEVATAVEDAAVDTAQEEATGESTETAGGETAAATASEEGKAGPEAVDALLEALAPSREAFHSSLAVTVDQVRGYLEAHETRDDDGSGRMASELGPFAAGRIDVARLTEIIGDSESISEAELVPMRRAFETLSAVMARGAEVHRVQVPAGGDLQGQVAAALAECGRIFGAARVFELARSGRYVAEQHEPMMEAFPFHRWNGKEREIAPPLVVEVNGADLHAGGLAEFLDGGQKIALAVSGQAPPAPLVRLITPGVFVMQTGDPNDVRAMAEQAGPAIAAVLPETAGRFVHEPGGDEALGRLEVSFLPDEAPRRDLGSVTAFQQQQELKMLTALAAASAGPTAAAPAAPPAGPASDVDLLAAWLIQQADLSDL